VRPLLSISSRPHRLRFHFSILGFQLSFLFSQVLLKLVDVLIFSGPIVLDLVFNLGFPTVAWWFRPVDGGSRRRRGELKGARVLSKGNWVFLGLSAERIERREVLDEISGGPRLNRRILNGPD
jgi:hypothetical protein